MAGCRHMGSFAAGCVAAVVVGTALGTLISGFLTNAAPVPGEKCYRSCNGEKKTCSFEFNVHRYQTLSRACQDCPSNVSHCSLPDCIAGNGIKRLVTVTDRKLPGTAIHVCQGDSILIKVRNALPTAGVALHWHGLSTDAFADGAASLTRPLVGPQKEFLFTLNARQPGTFFWQSAAGFDGGDGLFGPLIVRQPHLEDPNSNLYDYDWREHTIIVNDWLHVPSGETFVLHHHSGGDHFPRDLLVNGKGKYTGQDSTSVSEQTPETVFYVTPGKRYRFRLISAAFSNCPVVFSVSSHLLTVIAADGSPLVPFNTTEIIVQPGERWDFVLKTDQDRWDPENYWMHFRGFKDCSANEVSQRAILKYVLYYVPGQDVAPDTEEKAPIDGKYQGLSKIVNPLDGDCRAGVSSKACLTDLISTTPAPDYLDKSADVSLYYEFNLRYLNNPAYYDPHRYSVARQELSITDIPSPQINNLSLSSLPSSQFSVEIPSDGEPSACNLENMQLYCAHDFCECLHLQHIPLGAVVDLILVDAGGDTNDGQSVHLQGHSFHVLGHGPLPWRSVDRSAIMGLYKDGALRKASLSPIVKDTISIPKGGYALVRFRADNPGYWPLHSQFLFHREAGMSVILKVGEQTDLPVPPDGVAVCS